jgi:hypothetical protein
MCPSLFATPRKPLLINFLNSLVYGVKTLSTFVKYVNQRLGLRSYPLFAQK